MEQELARIETAHKVAWITLARPAARNSLSLAMLDRLHHAIETLGRDDQVHVIVIAAEGPAFCAGHDLKELTAARAEADRGRAFFTETMDRCARLMMSIVQCPKPVIASVQGIATAAGCQLVATCDLAVASEEARFATPGVNIGLFCSTPMVALSRNVSRKQAMKMLLTGEMIPASEALAQGLVSDVVAAEDLRAETEKLARAIAEKSPATLRIGKEAFYRQVEMPLPEAYAFTAQVMVENMLEPDAEEGIGAFVEKRVPEWRPLGGGEG
ncbi:MULTISPECIES: enoyl-CoA hydratase [unclassified Sulfitobacter]|uniref:enoyl-CoA hydratase n=3 Tax=Sulfitobacter TaxID=60136 RepID=UPI000A94BC7A|nr:MULTISPECIES: enoyl-CoA hydratase [unclassified Sulfitobacter]